MIADLWSSFPRLLEQSINGLLDEAEPNVNKAFQLYKSCQREELWAESFDEFQKRLNDFYSRPRSQRCKNDFDVFLSKPMPRHVYDSFHLTFRNAWVSGKSLLSIANWAHNLIRVGYKTTSVVISADVLTQTLHAIINPAPYEKDENIEFEDFCASWKKTVFRLFGRRHDAELEPLLKELHWLHRQLKESETTQKEKSFFPTIYLTQTEIDWVLAIRQATLGYTLAPKFPLARGPQKQRLVDLQRAAALYNIVQTTKLPELLKHRENIRATILDRCDGLIREKAA